MAEKRGRVKLGSLALALFLTLSALAANNYQPLTVGNFVAAGPTLAAQHAKVHLTGLYVREGNVPVVFENLQQLTMTLHSLAGTNSYPRVPLLADNASTVARKAFIACDAYPATPGIGCQISVNGTATMCALTNVFGASQQNVPCLDVDDGSSFIPQGPTREQMEEYTREQNAQMAERVKNTIGHGGHVEECRELGSNYLFKGRSDSNLTNTACGGESVAECTHWLTLEQQLDGHVGPDAVATANNACTQAHQDYLDALKSAAVPPPSEPPSPQSAVPNQRAIIQRCMAYLQSTGTAERRPGEFDEVCAKEQQ